MSRRQQNDSLRDSLFEGRDEHFLDVDRMVNEGLAGGIVSPQNGRIDDTTTDTMDDHDAVNDPDTTEPS
ncbi:hypothetical protein [Brevibacillus marinus]|uniref:hypothetical protein n=1 Tax=Brevibacillus marinus TaxID=2496837 RepID=UPI000F816A75|nr:hypothetical protein [Brevibacillus marinus]